MTTHMLHYACMYSNILATIHNCGNCEFQVHDLYNPCIGTRLPWTTWDDKVAIPVSITAHYYFKVTIFKLASTLYVTGSEKTRLSGIFYISRNTAFKYSSHSGLLMPNCRDVKFTA